MESTGEIHQLKTSVGADGKDTESGGEIPHLKEATGADGKTYPRQVERKAAPKPEPLPVRKVAKTGFLASPFLGHEQRMNKERSAQKSANLTDRQKGGKNAKDER